MARVFDEWAIENFANAYRNWLEQMVTSSDGLPYGILLDILHDIQFEWELHDDEYRAKDGIYLRADFEWESKLEVPAGWDDWPCSFLEFAVALARKMYRTVSYDPEDENGISNAFWEMLGNVGLDEFDDGTILELGSSALDEINDIVDVVMRREYLPNGVGGLFPLSHPDCDQRDMEYWYQMNAYAIEKRHGC